MTRCGLGLCAAAVSVLLINAPVGARQHGQQPFGVDQATPRPTPPAQLPSPPPMSAPLPGVPSDARSPESIGLRAFSVSLVLGEMQGTGTADTLPAGAKKAITDMREFLPYKNYRMLDVQWALCCSSRTPTGISGRLRGVEEDDHWFQVYVREINGNKMSVWFQLRDVEQAADETTHQVLTAVTQAERERRLSDLMQQRDALDAELRVASTKLGSNHPDILSLRRKRESVDRQLDEARRTHAQGARTTTASRRSSGRLLLDNTFSMEVGETVVIGTSRVRGDKALIALLTAASRPTSSSR